jgi:DNA-directed RNA polymerase subunit M/transcription elongation factor TFIIS
MDKSRALVREILKKNISKPEKSKKYEVEIYNMCVRLSKSTKKKIIDIYKKEAFEKVGELIVAEKKGREDTILNDIKNNSLGWDSQAFIEQKNSYEKIMNKSVQKPIPVKGMYVCKDKECGSDLFYTWSLQTRSQDEPATLFRECAQCGKRGRT